MAEFCKDCSKALNIMFDGFYEGEICEHCGVICQKQKKSILCNLLYYLKLKRRT